MNNSRWLRQQLIYKVPFPAAGNPSQFKPYEFRVVHACERRKLILMGNQFDNSCRERYNGIDCKFCNGHSSGEIEELLAKGYRIDFHGKNICDPRPR